MSKLRLPSAWEAIPATAVQQFQTLYERYYDIALPFEDAEIKLRALLGLLSAIKEHATQDAARGGAGQDCAAVQRFPSAGHDEYYRDQFSQTQTCR